jgi:hypothetical protein
VKKRNKNDVSLVFLGSQVSNVMVSHALKRCTIVRFGKSSFGDVTDGIRVDFGENIGYLFTTILEIDGIKADLDLHH